MPKLLIALLISHTILSSCNKPIDPHSFIGDCCCTNTKLQGDANTLQLFTADTVGYYFYVANTMTPNGDNINDALVFVLTVPQHNRYEASISKIEIYNEKDELVTSLKGNIWNGEDANGTADNGNYHYKAFITFNQEELVASGSFCLLTCFMTNDDRTGLTFSDQIHPTKGFIMATNEPFPSCE